MCCRTLNLQINCLRIGQCPSRICPSRYCPGKFCPDSCPEYFLGVNVQTLSIKNLSRSRFIYFCTGFVLALACYDKQKCKRNFFKRVSSSVLLTNKNSNAVYAQYVKIALEMKNIWKQSIK